MSLLIEHFIYLLLGGAFLALCAVGYLFGFLMRMFFGGDDEGP